MPKAFLSHSSVQKEYVENVASDLKSFSIIDSKSFEFGMLNSEEILNLIDKSDLFVVFLSNEALDSGWVENELTLAYENLQEGKLKRIYPIIIDNSINFKDDRIPLWLKSYNLQLISRYKKSARLIKSRLREISWNKHPKLQNRDQLFAGRNLELSKVEERFDNIDLKTPSVLIASGIPKIGRKKFLTKSLIKTNTVFRESIEHPSISLDTRESIEDFIIKLYDLGISQEINFPNFMTISQEEKVSLSCKIIKDIALANEIIFIEDFGAIVLPDGKLAEWFWSILSELEKLGICGQLIFCLASRFRTKPSAVIHYDDIFQINITELKKTERTGLFKRLLNIYNINIGLEDIKKISNFFTGFPEQIFYTVNFLEKSSAKNLLDKPEFITNYHKSTLR